MSRVCECGCGRSLEGRRVDARYANTACRVAAHRARQALAPAEPETTGEPPAPPPATPVSTVNADLATGIARWGVRPEATPDILRRAAEDNPEDLDDWFAGLTQTIPAYFQPSTGGSARTISRTGPAVSLVQYMDPEEFGEHLEDIASGRLK